MVLVKEGTILTEDPWIFVDDETPIPTDGPVIISLTRLRDERPNRPAGELGVQLQPADDATEITAEELAGVSLVAVTFPAYKDGRGYTQARNLRERLGYQGEIRAVGDVLYDQLAYMQRVGFSAFEVRKAADAEDFAKAVSEFSHAYQATPDGKPTAIKERHSK